MRQATASDETQQAEVPGPSGAAADDATTYVGFSLPVEDPSLNLPEPANEIVQAARRLLLSGGFEALRVDAIVREARKNKASVKYYFGNKRGLLYALADSLDHEQCLALAEQTRDAVGEERLQRYIAGQTELAGDGDSFLMFFDLLPHVIRDEELRARVSRLYEWYHQMNLVWLGLTDKVTDENRDRLQAFVGLMVAVVDGLAIQAALRPTGFDVAASFDILELFLKRCLDEVVGDPGGDGSVSPAEPED
jgi:AcrR family transcriptional regulator